MPRRKVWLQTPAAGVSCSNAANTGERKTWTQSEFCTWQNSVRRQEPPKCVHNVPAHETAKHRAKFGWPPLSDVGAVAKPRRETGWNLLRCPKPANGSQPLVGTKFIILWGHVEEILTFKKFFPIVDKCLSCENITRQSCATVRRWRIFGDYLRPVFSAWASNCSVQHISHLHSIFVLSY